MCGITGVYSRDNFDVDQYYNAHTLLKHRGPDDEGFFYSDCFGDYGFAKGDDSIGEINHPHISEIDNAKIILGHRRLSILDLSAAGHQPMQYDNLVLVFNGEIFNFIELREELVKEGYVFTSNTDTEVFLKSFHCWGVEAFNRYNGMWAAAIYDTASKRLILTRDRYGIKPLFYHAATDEFYFGSEIKFITPFLGDLVLNNEIAFDYLRYCYLDHSDETFIQCIHSIKPGHYLVFDDHQVNIHSYYQLKPADSSNLEQLIKGAVALRMRSDVEVGALLSGGIDSTSLVCLVKDLSLSEHLKTFTADFDEKEFSERLYVEKTLEKTGFHGSFIHIDAQTINNTLQDVLLTRESPFRSMSVMLQYLLFQFIHQSSNVKVILSGEGADEVFTGYTSDLYTYLIYLLQEGEFSKFLHEFRCISQRTEKSTLQMIQILTVNIVSELLGMNNLRVKRGFSCNLKREKNTRYQYNALKNKLYRGLTFSALQEYLTDNDRNSMRFSIEARVPFLDYRVVSRAFAYQTEEYIENGVTKMPLRKIMGKLMPEEIIQRKDKMGFISPQEIWQKKEFKSVLDRGFSELLDNHPVFFLDYDEIGKMYDEYQEGRYHDWAFIWRIFCLHEYMKIWNLNVR